MKNKYCCFWLSSLPPMLLVLSLCFAEAAEEKKEPVAMPSPSAIEQQSKSEAELKKKEEATAAQQFSLQESAFKGTALEQTKEEKKSTETLNKRIQRIVSSIPPFELVSVAVTDGVVTLRGKVLTAGDREDVVKLVKAMDGVVYVVNKINLETQVDKTLSPIVGKLEDYWSNIIAFLPLAIIALLILGFFAYVSRLLGKWEAPFKQLPVNPLFQAFLRQILRTVFFALGLLFALDVLGATPFVTAILGAAGLLSFAIGFALKDIIENYLAGMLLSVRQPFASNDLVKIGDNQGKVLRLTARELVLMTLDGNHVIIPNATVFKSEIYNYTRNPSRRFSFVVGVDVNEDLVAVQKLGVATLRKLGAVLAEPPPYSIVEALGDFNVLVRFFGWVDQRNADFNKVQGQAIRMVKEAFDEAKVLMPEPITNARVQIIAAQQPLVKQQEPAQAEKAAKEKNKAKQQKVEQVISRQASSQILDVSVDTTVDKQIEQDKAVSEEADLLDDMKKPHETRAKIEADKAAPLTGKGE